MREFVSSHFGVAIVYYDQQSIMDDIACLQNMLNMVESGKMKFPMLDFEANTLIPEEVAQKYLDGLAKDLKRRSFKNVKL